MKEHLNLAHCNELDACEVFLLLGVDSTFQVKRWYCIVHVPLMLPLALALGHDPKWLEKT
ncbi:hypothetical protein [Desulfosporosinus sp. Sb-LF]|uniref:hypothetical protein n=1 Tax=Desulfosporosinus sp. Sb-LF TaxID=2560027 RepID=UPI00107F87D8|nr:hypothetical protein [Desulfosporosinus sp. Sb-LF]TGE33019.1 hypothetical protein E4K68_09255 [Desulfosporosinus sp. Sb-LF]